MKNYIGISRDHSGSMQGITTAAKNDYNRKIDSIKNATIANKQDTIVSVVECGAGRGRGIQRVVVNSNVISLKPLDTYTAQGSGTPLWDSVGDLIEQFENTPDVNNPDVSFLVMAITDGHENASTRYNVSSLSRKIRELIMTDRWTFVFRVPRGHSRYITQLGIPEGNIQEWDQTNSGTAAASIVDEAAFNQYFALRSSGATSTSKFYTDLSNVSVKDVKQALSDISTQIVILNTPDNVVEIRPFVEAKIGHYKSGAAFYKLTKTETIQPQKKIVIRDKKGNKFYSGFEARHMINLPDYGNVKVTPGQHGGFDIFIQSTSVNRKLMPNTEVVYWNQA